MLTHYFTIDLSQFRTFDLRVEHTVCMYIYIFYGEKINKFIFIFSIQRCVYSQCGWIAVGSGQLNFAYLQVDE